MAELGVKSDAMETDQVREACNARLNTRKKLIILILVLMLILLIIIINNYNNYYYYCYFNDDADAMDLI